MATTQATDETESAVSVPVLSCEKCPALCKSRTKIVNGRGPEDADYFIVGEGPGNDEDKLGKPFVGDSGRLLAHMLTEAGVAPGDVYLSNSVRCRPAGNRKPKVSEIRACRPYLMEEIRRVNPKVIITTGATALTALYRTMKLGDIVGQTIIQPDTGIPIIPTYHPAYLMRGKWGQMEMVVSHLEKARQISQGKLGAQSLEDVQAGAKVMRTVDKVLALRDYLLSDDVAIITTDSETTGLRYLHDEILCVGFSALDQDLNYIGKGFTVPLHYNDKDRWPKAKNGQPKIPKTWRDGHIRPYWSEKDEPVVVEALRAIFDSGKPLAIQNAGFDIRMFERNPKDDPDLAEDVRAAYGFNVAEHVRFDTMLLQRIVNENLPYNETSMLTRLTDMPYYEDKINQESQGKTRMDLADNETIWIYQALDCDGLARALMPLVKRAKIQGVWPLHQKIHMPMIRAVWNMTRRGVYVDMDYFGRLADRYRELVTDAERQVMEAYGNGWFNLNKPDDIRNALFNVLGLPPSGRRPDGAKSCEVCTKDMACEKHDSTGKDALIDIKALMVKQGQDPHPILDAILAWKTVAKQRGTYVDGSDGESGLVPYIGRVTHRVHPEFFVNRADTGRIAAYDPPIQTWPKSVIDEVLHEKKALRRTFASPLGKVFMEADWSQGEVWVVAYESGDQTLLDLLLSGRDVHTYVARRMCESGISDKFPASAADPHLSDYEWKQEHGNLRTDAKVFVFGIDYGMTEAGIAERLHCSLDEAKQLKEFYLQEIFPKLSDYFEMIDFGMEQHGLTKAWSGRLGHVPDRQLVQGFSRWGQSAWEDYQRKGWNMPIQTGLNDIHMAIHPEIENDPAFAWLELVLAVHDSIAGYTDDVGPEELTRRAWQLKERMESRVKTLVRPDGTPLGWEIPVEISWGSSWGNLDNVLESSGELKLAEPQEEAAS